MNSNRISNEATIVTAFEYRALGTIAGFIVCAYSISKVVFSYFNVSETAHTVPKRIGLALLTDSDDDFEPIEEAPLEEKFKTIESIEKIDQEDNWEKYSPEITTIFKNSITINNNN